MIANATGCSSIYSASIPSTPYTKNAKGQGPAFDNSLFEDFCEFGLGMVMGNKKMKERIAHLLEEAKASEKVSAEFVAAADKWMANMNDSEGSKEAAAELKLSSLPALRRVALSARSSRLWITTSLSVHSGSSVVMVLL